MPGVSEDVIEEAAEVIFERLRTPMSGMAGGEVPTDVYTFQGVARLVANSLAVEGLLRSPRTEAEEAVIDAARAWVNAAVSAVVMWETKSDSDIAETLADAVAALDASEGGGS